MMTPAPVVEKSVNVTTNSCSQDYTHPNDRTLQTYDMTPGFKTLTVSFFTIHLYTTCFHAFVLNLFLPAAFVLYYKNCVEFRDVKKQLLLNFYLLLKIIINSAASSPGAGLAVANREHGASSSCTYPTTPSAPSYY